MDMFLEEWVRPYYMNFLNGNFVHAQGQKRDSFQQNVRRALSVIDESVIERLLAGGGREQRTGSWFCGLKGWSRFEDQLGELLLASRTPYTGQGISFAFACFADDQSAKYLVKYLDVYLPRIDLYYDQKWAMPALMWIDEQLNTEHAARYLVADGPWETYTANKMSSTDGWKLDVCKRRFWDVMGYCRQCFN